MRRVGVNDGREIRQALGSGTVVGSRGDTLEVGLDAKGDDPAEKRSDGSGNEHTKKKKGRKQTHLEKYRACMSVPTWSQSRWQPLSFQAPYSSPSGSTPQIWGISSATLSPRMRRMLSLTLTNPVAKTTMSKSSSRSSERTTLSSVKWSM
jgi:hypothetical protein